MRSRLPTRDGPKICAGWGRAVPIISCARASRRCSSRGIRRRRSGAARQARSASASKRIAKDYAEYYNACADAASPKLRDSNPSVVVVPGLGLFGFGKDKREARITSEFFVNAIHVMAGANALEDDDGDGGQLPQVRRPEQAATSSRSTTTSRCRGPRRSASNTGRSRKPSCSGCRPRRNSAARSSVVVGGGSGIGREVALEIAKRGGHVVVADANVAGAEETKAEAARLSSARW